MGFLLSAGRGEHYGDPRRSLVDAQYAVYEQNRIGDAYHVIGGPVLAHEVDVDPAVAAALQPEVVSPQAFPEVSPLEVEGFPIADVR